LADTGQWWVMKHAFDYETKMYVLTGVQNDYDRWFLKTTSSVSEKELQRDFWAGFRKYFHDDELEILDDDVAAEIATSYRAGSTGNRQGRLKTSIGKDGGCSNWSWVLTDPYLMW